MREIVKYVAYDGSEFDAAAKCLDYEENCMVVDSIMKALKPRPESRDFSNGGGFIQHPKDLFLRVRQNLLKQAAIECGHKWITQSMADVTVDVGWADRIISEVGTKSLVVAWHRIACTDKKYREWGQPYYTNNPEQGTQQEFVE